MLKKEELPACPVATTVQMVGSKWKLLILRNLLARPWRFNELRKKFRGDQPKSSDGQPALNGRRRHHHTDGLSGSPSKGGIFFERIRRIDAPYH